MARTVGVRFRQAGKIFYFDAGDYELPVSSYVVAQAPHGISVGRVVIAPDQVITSEGVREDELKPLVRIATEADVEKAEERTEQAKQAVIRAKEMAGEQGLGMSVASGEYDLDGSQFTAYFTATERVDFRGLARDLSRELGARTQFLQVGDRDRAKLTDGVDVCGERLCCSSWMTSFPSVSIRMAKEQDLPLNPQKISGVCGRLYCCLTFEYEDYKALRGTLPKVGSMLSTPAGEAKVTGIDFNREVVKLWLTESREPIEIAAIDFRLQHGVTVRPMEIVRRVEGSLRTITEDRSAATTRQSRQEQRGRRSRPGSRQGQAQPPVAPTPPPPPPTASAEAGDAGQKRRRRRRRRGRGGGGSEGAPPASE